MLDYFIPKDNEANYSAVYKQIREHVNEPVDTEDDKPSSREEIASIIKKFNLKKAPGEDGLISRYSYVFS